MILKVSLLTLGLSLPLSAWATAGNEIWTKGVNRDSGWFDFNKKNDLRDMGYCWAAAGSNILAWWQNQYEIPAGTPRGEEVWETFRDVFTSDYGGLPKYAIEWWLTGHYAKAGDRGWAQIVEGKTGGGYYQEYFAGERNISTYLKQSWNPDYTEISQNLIHYLRQDYGIALSLGNAANNYGHEITLWGLEYDSNGITKIFVTDSDDAIDSRNRTEPALLELECYALELATGGIRLGIRDEFGDAVFIENFDALGPVDFLNPIPEPSTFGLLAGLGTLALTLVRRRRVGTRMH